MPHQVDAGASILAWMGLALVDLHFTVLPCVAGHAITLVSSHVSPTGGAIVTGFVLTVIDLAFAVAAGVISRTFTVVGVRCVDTVAAMVAQVICLEPSLASGRLTGDSGDVTVASRPAASTVTDVRSILLATAPSVLTGRGASAPVNGGLTAVSGEALGAGAAEGLQAVLTDAPVETGLGVTLINLILAVGAGEA